MTTWEKIRCFLGFHNRVTICSIRCLMWSSSVFTGEIQRDVPGIAKITRCSRCGVRSGWISDGDINKRIDIDDLLIMVPSLKNNYDTCSEILLGIA